MVAEMPGKANVLRRFTEKPWNKPNESAPGLGERKRGCLRQAISSFCDPCAGGLLLWRECPRDSSDYVFSDVILKCAECRQRVQPHRQFRKSGFGVAFT